MTTKDEALKQALDALGRVAGDDLQRWKKVADPGSIAWHVLRAIATCRAALAQKDEQEPVAEITADDMGRPFNAIRIGAHFYKEIPPVGTKLYTATSKRKPLTDEQIREIVDSGDYLGMVFADGTKGIALDKVTVCDFARAVEAAHGIGGQHDAS